MFMIGAGDRDNGGIHVLQSELVRAGILDPDQQTGVYDQTTSDAVSEFQHSEGLPVDGEAVRL